MATIYTHAFVGLGLARVYATRRMPWLYWGLAALLPVVPDFDVFSTAAYGQPLGHRGLTHSLLFALWVGLFAASLTFRYFRVSFWSLSALFFLIIASHGLLDAMSLSGVEIPFFWPLESRYGRWGPMPTSDMGRGYRLLTSEMLWIWLPTTVVVAAVVGYRYLRRPRTLPAGCAVAPDRETLNPETLP